MFFFLDNIVTFYARERENSKDKTPTGDTHTQKKERENRNAHQKRRTPARYLSRNYFPWLKTCSFVRSTRLKRERNVGYQKKRWQKVVPFFCVRRRRKGRRFSLFAKKRQERRRGETLNPTRPTERKKALLQMPSGIDGRERERRLRRDAKRERAFHPKKKTFAAVSFCVLLRQKTKRGFCAFKGVLTTTTTERRRR